MYSQIYKYLVLNKKLSIPGIGKFVIQALPAKLDFVERVLHAPNQSISFIDAEVVSDKNLIQYISKELNIDEWQAINDLQAFAESVKANIGSTGKAHLPGIGTLRQSINNALYLDPENNNEGVLNDITLGASDANNGTIGNLVQLYKTGDSLIFTEELESDQLEKIVKEESQDYWWVYAVVLALMGVGALLYYYI